jgi:hypothetical protein
LNIFGLDHVPTGPFVPFAFHNKDGDCFEFYVSPNDYYGERIDDYLTVFLDTKTDEVVGFMVKNIKHIVEKVSASKTAWTFIVNDNEEVQLNGLFTMMLSHEKSPEGNKILVLEYKRIAEIAETNKIDRVPIRDLVGV